MNSNNNNIINQPYINIINNQQVNNGQDNNGQDNGEQDNSGNSNNPSYRYNFDMILEYQHRRTQPHMHALLTSIDIINIIN